jgi:Do/DeqQ family serine protease
MRNIPKALVILALTLCAGSMQYAVAGTPSVSQQNELPSLAPMLQKVLPGVVSIAVKGHMPAAENPLLADPFFRRYFGLPKQQQPKEREFKAAGSGVVVDPRRGYVITNNHVVDKADEITVTLSDGRRLKAKKIGTDPATDVAVIQIPAKDLHGVPLGNSDTLRVGDYVVAVGNPFGLSETVTSGIVSALGRTGLGIEGYEDFIQTDASINPGNSGGALVNLRGELVGINSAILGPSGGNIGIGFAIPINMARKVMNQIIAHGKVSRGQLGVLIQDLTPELAKAMKLKVQHGALISQVTPNSPAQKAGLKSGDVIVKLNGKAVQSSAELRNTIGLLPIGTKLVLDVIHNGSAERVTATLAEAEQEKLKVPKSVAALAGVMLGSIEPGSELYGRAQGAVVLKVKGGSPAAQAGLQSGDAIVAVDQQPVRSPEDVVRIAEKNKGQVLLQVVRDGGGLYIIIG